MEYKSDFMHKLIKKCSDINHIDDKDFAEAERLVRGTDSLKLKLNTINQLKEAYKDYFYFLNFNYVRENADPKKIEKLKNLEFLLKHEESSIKENIHLDRLKREYDNLVSQYEETAWNNPKSQYKKIKQLHTQIKNLKTKSEGYSPEFVRSVRDLEEKIDDTLDDFYNRRKTSLQRKAILALVGVGIVLGGFKATLMLEKYKLHRDIAAQTSYKHLVMNYDKNIDELKRYADTKIGLLESTMKKEIEYMKKQANPSDKKNILDSTIKRNAQYKKEHANHSYNNIAPAKAVNHDKIVFHAKKTIPDQNNGFYTYVVHKGDYLSKIAKRMTGDADNWKEIAKYNNLCNPNRIFPGNRIKIPFKMMKKGYNDA